MQVLVGPPKMNSLEFNMKISSRTEGGAENDLNEYWKLYEKLQCWKNEVWCQLLKSQISALT